MISDCATRIMLGLEVFKYEAGLNINGRDTNMNHGTEVSFRLSSPWTETGRLVCADNYFASFETANLFYRHGLLFTSVAKKATKMFPTAYLSTKVVVQYVWTI